MPAQTTIPETPPRPPDPDETAQPATDQWNDPTAAQATADARRVLAIALGRPAVGD